MIAALDTILEAAASAEVHARTGHVVRATGESVTTRGLNLRVHELAFVEDPAGRPLAAECSSTHGAEMHISLLDRGAVTVGSRVHSSGAVASAPSGNAVLGRIIDGLGRPLDEGGPLSRARWVPVFAEPPSPLARQAIERRLATGIRAIDTFSTVGRGQRIGIFAGSGVGKSTTLGMLARGTEADVTVIALIGERGREVRDFIEHDLGFDALKHSVVVASTGDTPAAMRLCAANAATAIAEGFRDEGRDVLLLFDSLTRVAMAQREIGLAAGEPPAMRGYPPSVFSLLPHLMERAGPGQRGSITAVYTVLVDGDDMEEPIADISRATLDGHIVLKRALATAGHYPPIDVLSSVSRLMNRVAEPHHIEAARRIRSLLAAHEEARDLISIGAYVRGSDPEVDRALERLPDIHELLRQSASEITPIDESIRRLSEIAEVPIPGVDDSAESQGDAPGTEVPAPGETPADAIDGDYTEEAA
jgi:flagellum-specific ATP synthase